MQKVFYFFNFAWFFLILAFTSMEIQARVGEEKSKLEIRLFRSGGLQIKEDKLIKQKQKGVSYLKFEPYFPSSTELDFIIKHWMEEDPSHQSWKMLFPKDGYSMLFTTKE